MEFMDGIKVTDYAERVLNDQNGGDSELKKIALLEAVIGAFAHQIFVHGTFNADPHPGNIFVSESGSGCGRNSDSDKKSSRSPGSGDAPPKIVLLDWGMT